MATTLKLAEESNFYYFSNLFNNQEWQYNVKGGHGIYHELIFNSNGEITCLNDYLLKAFKEDSIGQNLIEQNKTVMAFFKKIDTIALELSIKKEHVVDRKNGEKDYGFYVKVKNEPIIIWAMYKEEKKEFVVHGVFVHNDPKNDPIKRAIHEVPKKNKQRIISALKECIKKESKYRVKLLVDNTFHK